MTSNVDGSKALAEQEITLNGLELANFAKVTKYEKKATATASGAAVPSGGASGGAGGAKLNEATLEDAPPGHQQLHLTDGVMPAGGTKAFSGTVYVSGKEKTVIGFR